MLKRTIPLLLLVAACGGSAGADILSSAATPDGSPTGQATGQADASTGSPVQGSDSSATTTPDASTDPGQDAGVDSSLDAGQDSAADSGQDSGADAGEDAGQDAGQDADAGQPPPPPPPPPTYYGVSFDRATTEYLSAPYPAGLVGSSTVTFEGWFYVRQPTDEGRFFQAYGISCSYANSVAYGAMRGHINCLAGTSGPQNQVFSQQLCPMGQWFHLAFVLSGGTFTMYVDGKSQGTAVPDFGATVPGFGGVQVKWGGTGNATNETLDGVADEVRVSKTADYAADFAPPAHLASPGFLLDEGAGKPTSIDGTAGNMVGCSWTTVVR